MMMTIIIITIIIIKFGAISVQVLRNNFVIKNWVSQEIQKNYWKTRKISPVHKMDQPKLINEGRI